MRTTRGNVVISKSRKRLRVLDWIEQLDADLGPVARPQSTPSAAPLKRRKSAFSKANRAKHKK